MDFDQAIGLINLALRQHKPKLFSSSWIFYHAPQAYHYIRKNIKTPLGDIDWDKVTCKLDREFQKAWAQRRPQKVKPYRKISEVRKVLKPFQEKLYIFITPADENDRLLRDAISVALVRLAQKGNIKAQQELLPLLRYMVDQWIELSPRLRKWKGYSDDIDDKIKSCIRLYRFTGTFIGYLFRTLEYSSWGLKPLEAFSLDDTISCRGEKRRSESVVQEPGTGQITMYERSAFADTGFC
jgi:hypothetical protein